MEPPTGNHRYGTSSRPRPGGCLHARTPAIGGHSPTAVLGMVTIPGCPERVSDARAFVRRALASAREIDSDAATLLTSELVTNAIQHTRSGASGGTVRIVVEAVPDGVLIQVIDAGAADVPVVKGDLFTIEGHGLFLVQQLAAQWGYLRGPEGTTVWFHLAQPDRRRPADPAASSPASASLPLADEHVDDDGGPDQAQERHPWLSNVVILRQLRPAAR